MNIAASITLSALLLVGICGSAMAADVVWHEGEDFAKVTNTTRANVSNKPVASGGKALFGPSLDTKDSIVEYAVQLPKPIADAQVIFRYARLHWRETMVPAAMKLEIVGSGAPVVRQIAFPDTKGWGSKPTHWGLLTVELGDLPAGEATLRITSGADNNSINLDGFFIAGADFEVTAEELSSLLRLKVTSAGYVGFPMQSGTIRQDRTKALPVAVRTFAAGVAAKPVAARLQPPGGEGRPLVGVAARASSTTEVKIVNFTLPKLSDASYTLVVVCERPAAEITVPLTLVGEFMSTLDARAAKLEAFSTQLATADSPAAMLCKADFEHAVEFIKAGQATMNQSTARAAGSAWREHVAAQERQGQSDPAPLAMNMALTLDQYEQTMTRLKAAKAPYAERTGQFRRGYRSKASGDLLAYRSLVPKNYNTATSVPLILMLHGGGGDEDYFHDMDGGAILRIVDQRGYLMISPKYHRRTQPTYLADLLQLIELTRAQYPKIDPSRIYVTGISMGGGATYRITTGNPDLFAAGCVVSGGGDPEVAHKLATTPMLFLHGGADTVVPVSRPKAVVAKMEELGLTHKLRVFAPHGHEYHAEQYLNLTLDFFDQYRKPAKP